MTANIYQSPDIRRQTLDQAAANIQQKRVSRLMAAMKVQNTLKERAAKIHAKDLERFAKQSEIVNRWLEKATEAIDKAHASLGRLNEINHGLVNAELIITAND